MNYFLSPCSFQVRELFSPRLSEKGLYYYTLEKKGVSHKEAVKRIKTKPIWFCGIKDKNARTMQWLCTIERINDIEEKDLIVKFKGCSNERIFVGKHKGNEFKVEAELSEKEQKKISGFKAKKELVCNYFGEQRFCENNIEIIEALERKEYECALRLFLTKKSRFDSEKSTKIKKIIAENWNDWEKISEEEEIKTTKKAVLFDFLKKNPDLFEDAFLHAEPRAVKAMVKAAQAMRFNKKLCETAKQKKPKNNYTQIAGQNLALGASKAFPRMLAIEPNEFEKKFRRGVLERKTFFNAECFRIKKLSGKKSVLSFRLPRGCYATIFLKYLCNWLDNQ